MSADPGPVDVTALVVLRSATGRSAHGDDVITSESLSDFLPDPDDVDTVASAFRALGCQVGTPFGISLAISAPRERMEEIFGVALASRSDGTWTVVGDVEGASEQADSDEPELPLDALPPEVARLVSAIVLEPPAELHGDVDL